MTLLLPPLRSSRYRVWQTTPAVSVLRATYSGRRVSIGKISRQQFDEMTPEFYGNLRSKELNLTWGFRGGWIDCILIAARGEADSLVTFGFVVAKTIQTTDRYSHLNTHTLRRALTVLDQPAP